MTVILPGQWQIYRQTLPPVQMLIDPILPASGITFMHGPPGAGKSAILWSIGQAVQNGSAWFGLPTQQTGVLLLSNDMNDYQLSHRWGDEFKPDFVVNTIEEMDICDINLFKYRQEFADVQKLIADFKIGLVLIDASGGLHLGRSNTKDEVAEMVYHSLKAWLGPVAILLLHHDRKAQRLKDGSFADPADEDFLGSNRWRSKAVSHLHAYATRAQKTEMRHAKSQVAITHPENFQIYINLQGGAEPWSDKRASEVVKKWHDGVKDLRLGSKPISEQVLAIAAHYGVTERTAWRWNKLVDK